MALTASCPSCGAPVVFKSAGSIFARCEALLRPAIEASIADEAMDQTRGACTIVAAQLGEAIGDFGAATVAGLGSVGSLNPAAPPVEERPPR